MNGVSTRVAIAALAATTGLAVPFAVSAALRDEPAPPAPVADPFPLWHSAEEAPEPTRVVRFRGIAPAAPVPTMGRAERVPRSSRRARETTVAAGGGAASRQATPAADTALRATTRAPTPATSAPAPAPVRVAPPPPPQAPSTSPPVRSAPRPAAPRQPSGPRFDSTDSFDSTG